MTRKRSVHRPAGARTIRLRRIQFTNAECKQCGELLAALARGFTGGLCSSRLGFKQAGEVSVAVFAVPVLRPDRVLDDATFPVDDEGFGIAGDAVAARNNTLGVDKNRESDADLI